MSKDRATQLHEALHSHQADLDAIDPEVWNRILALVEKILPIIISIFVK